MLRAGRSSHANNHMQTQTHANNRTRHYQNQNFYWQAFEGGSSAFFAVNFVILLQAYYFKIIRNKISYFAPWLPRENWCEVWRYKLKKQRSFPELAEVPCVTFQLVPRFLWRIKIGKWFNWYCWCNGVQHTVLKNFKCTFSPFPLHMYFLDLRWRINKI